MEKQTAKQTAIKMRKNGYSYSFICDETGLSKSTLSNWLKEIPFKPNEEVLKKVSKSKLKSALFKNNQKIADIHEKKRIAKKEIGTITHRDLMLLGIGIYLGEGTKLNEEIRIINSDPEIIKISIWWFIDCCGLTLNNFNPCLHLYPDNDINKSIDYWSKKTGLPKESFGKTQVDKRENKQIKKRGKLPHGTLHLYVRSRGNKEFGRSLHRKIMGWIKAVESQKITYLNK